MRWLEAGILLSCVACVPGCAGQRAARPGSGTSTGVEFIVPPAAQTYRLDKNQKLILGDMLGPPALPVYPSQVGKTPLPIVEVCLELVIGEHGSVESSKLIKDMPSCNGSWVSSGMYGLFVDSARDAVSRWYFLPTKVCIYPAGVDADRQSDDCSGKGVKVRDIPIKLAYRFTFLQTPNGPKVRAEHTRLQHQ